MLTIYADRELKKISSDIEPEETICRPTTMVRTNPSEVEAGIEALLPRLWRFAITLTRDPVAAEDLVQDTCLRMLDRASQFRPGTHLDRWAFTIMANFWRSDLRRTVRRGNPADGELDKVEDETPGADQSFFARQVLDAVDALPEGQRSVVVLVCGEGFSYREAADILGIPIGTVMSRLHTVRSKLAPLAQD